MSLTDPQVVTSTVRRFTSWIIWGMNGEDSSAFLSHSTELALILIRHGQYKAAEVKFFYYFSTVKNISSNNVLWRIFSEPLPFFPALFTLSSFLV